MIFDINEKYMNENFGVFFEILNPDTKLMSNSRVMFKNLAREFPKEIPDASGFIS